MPRRCASYVGRAKAVLLLGLAFAARPAYADRTSHLFVDETQLVPEGDVELENWIWAQGQIPSAQYPYTTGWVWFGPTVGFSNHLEMSLPLVVESYPERTVLYSISLVARYRLFPREQDDGLQPLLRVEYQQPLSKYPYRYGNPPETVYYSYPPLLKILLVATYGNLTGVRGTVNVGVQLGLPFLLSSSVLAPASRTMSALGTAALALSVPLTPELRIAAELDGQLPLAGSPNPNLGQLYLGPSLAWTRGQIWVTFGTLFGLTNNSYRYLPKVLWGITF